MGFAREGVWVMGYCGPMGYGVHFPAHQVGGWPGLWVKRGYGLSEVWVKRGSTVLRSVSNESASASMPRRMSLKTCIDHCELELKRSRENAERAVASRVHAKRNHGTKSPLIPE